MAPMEILRLFGCERKKMQGAKRLRFTDVKPSDHERTHSVDLMHVGRGWLRECAGARGEARWSNTSAPTQARPFPSQPIIVSLIRAPSTRGRRKSRCYGEWRR